jgi:hypothetical protein
MFLTCVHAFWHPMHLKGLMVNGKQLGTTTWTSSSTYVINYFFYIYIVCYYIDIFLSLSHLEISITIVCIYTWWSVQGYSWCYELSKTLDPWPGYQYNTFCCQWVRHWQYLCFVYLIHCVYCLLVISFLLTQCLFTFGDFDAVSSTGYYCVFVLNLRDSRIFILDPTTTAIVDKEDRMKRFSRALKQVEENIARVVRLKHSNYEGKIWQHCITDNVPYFSR